MPKKERNIIEETLSISTKISDIAGKIADTETQQSVNEWLAESEENRELFEKICSEETAKEKIRLYKNSDADQAFDRFLEARNRRSKRRMLYRILSGAAVVAVGFSVWGLLDRQNQETPILPVAETGEYSFSTTANKPVLTLGDGTQMNVSGNDIRIKETEKGQQIMSGDSLISHKEDSTATDSYNMLEVPAMCDFNFTLSDGTKVWMNAASSLKYPTKFAADSRTVYASGEIYLEVAKDTGRPFYVVVDGITVKVLGTSFNIRSYANENDTKITLIEGGITAQIDEKDYTLTPGKQLTQGKATGSVAIGDIDPNEVTSWLKGYYIFKKARLQDVVSTLQNWYGVHIRLSGETSASTYYTGVVNKEEDIEIFLRRLEETSDVKCSKKGNTVTIY